MAGYLDQVEIEGSAEEDAKTALDTNRTFLIGGIVVLTAFLLQDLYSWLNVGGGIFSTVAALAKVHLKPAFVGIDKDSLFILFLIPCWFAAFGICRAFRLQFDVTNRAAMLVPALSITGAAFILNGLFAEPIIGAYMARQGYSRCVSGDWSEGNGRASISLADYVLTTADCHTHRASR